MWHQPEGLVPGRPVLYATTCGACEARLRSAGHHPRWTAAQDRRQSRSPVVGRRDLRRRSGVDSRAVRQPAAGVPTTARPARARGPTSTTRSPTRSAGSDRTAARVRILTPTITSPTHCGADRRLRQRVQERAARHLRSDFGVGDPRRARAHPRRPAAPALPLRSRRRHRQLRRRFSRHLDLAGGVHPRLHQPAANRTRRRQPAKSYHVQIESRLSLTGSNADRRLRVGAGRDGSSSRRTWRRALAQRAGLPFAADGLAASPSEPAIEAIADRLWAARGPRSGDLGQPGRPRPAAVQLHQPDDRRLRHDRRSGASVVPARGQRRRIWPSCAPSCRAARSGADRRRRQPGLRPAGRRDAGQRPAPRAARRQHRRADRRDGRLAHFVCPDHHYLESWSDAEPVAGVVSLTQPTIQPLHDTRALIESLSAWGTGKPQPALDLVRAHWKRAVSSARRRRPSPFDVVLGSRRSSAAWRRSRRVRLSADAQRGSDRQPPVPRDRRRAGDGARRPSCRHASRWCCIRRSGCSTAGMGTTPGSTSCPIR